MLGKSVWTECDCHHTMECGPTFPSLRIKIDFLTRLSKHLSLASRIYNYSSRWPSVSDENTQVHIHTHKCHSGLTLILFCNKFA